ncbi:Transcriptional regulator [Rhizophlyctis rosea]|nr:Transcriptional regulator [Rhizophlyctis rosea]
MASPAPPSSKPDRPPPSLRTVPADEPTTFTLYRQYVTQPNSIDEGGQAAAPGPIPPLPSAFDLQRLVGEMQSMVESRKARLAALRSNYDTMNDWLRAGGVMNPKDVMKETPKQKVKLVLGAPEVKAEPQDSSTSSTPDSRKRKRDDGEFKIKIPATKASGIERTGSSSAAASASIIPNGASTPHQNLASSSRPTPTPKAKKKGGKKTQGYKKNRLDKLKKRVSTASGEDITPAPPPPEPQEDKKDALDGDFSKAKAAANQVPIAQFWSWCEQFFRNITEDDLKLLDNEVITMTLRGALNIIVLLANDYFQTRKEDQAPWPFIVPPLGKHYTEQWAEEETKLEHDLPPHHHHGFQNCEYIELDDLVREGDISIRPLDERIISCLIADNLIPRTAAPALMQQSADEDDAVEPGSAAVKRSSGDYLDCEERIRRELLFIGLGDEEEDYINPDEDDEICKELREKQAQLRELSSVNLARKRKLKERAEDWMGKQQYYSVLDELNKAVETAFNKRFKTPAKTKAKKHGRRGAGDPGWVADDVVQKLEERERFIREIGSHFRQDKFRVPKRSIYEEGDGEEEGSGVEGGGGDGGGGGEGRG